MLALRRTSPGSVVRRISRTRPGNASMVTSTRLVTNSDSYATHYTELTEQPRAPNEFRLERQWLRRHCLQVSLSVGDLLRLSLACYHSIFA